MTVTTVDQIQSTVFLDRDDLTELEHSGTLAFSLGDRRFELHTCPCPPADPYAIRVTPEHLDSLRTAGRVEFRRTWGRLAVEMTEASR